MMERIAPRPPRFKMGLSAALELPTQAKTGLEWATLKKSGDRQDVHRVSRLTVARTQLW